jgi:hypothetical protein
MAEINWGLIDTQSPAKIANALMPSPEQQGAQALQVMQLQQAARQGQVSQMQMDQARKDKAALEKFYGVVAANGGPSDPIELEKQLIGSGVQHFVDLGITARQKRIEQEKFGAILNPSLAAPTPTPSAPPPIAAEPGSFAADVAMRRAATAVPWAVPPQTNALAPMPAIAPAPQTNALAPTLTPGGSDVTALRRKRDALLTLGTANGNAAAAIVDREIETALRPSVYHVVPNVGLVESGTGRVITPAVESKDPLIKEYEYAKNQGFTGSLFDYKKQITAAGRTQATPSAPVAVAMPDGSVKYVSREEAITKGMTPANAMEGLTPKEIQKREAVYPQATGAVKQFETNADILLAQLKKLRDSEGLSGITGQFAGRTLNITPSARSAQADLKTIKAEGTLGALTALRSLSKTGGALGNTSDKDVELLNNSYAALDQVQNTEDFKRKIDDAIFKTESAKKNARETYDMTYEYKTKRPSATTKGGASGSIGKWGTAVAE